MPETQSAKSHLPPWVTRYPSDPEYYIGVGGAPDSGNPTADLEHARANALAQLASEIEVSVRSDQTFRESTTSADSSSSTADIIVQTLTSQNLEGVELVDSFHSAADGYWFYFRLSKSAWDRIKNREMYELRDRILAMLGPLDVPSVSIAERLRRYSSALGLLRDSSYGGKITARLGGVRGVLDDLISARVSETLNGLAVSVDPGSMRFPPGRPPELAVRITTTEHRPIGVLKLEIRDSHGTVVAGMTTDSGGRFQGAISVSKMKSGKRLCTVGLSRAILDGVDEAVTSRAPQSPLELEVLPLAVHLQLAGPETLDSRWLVDSITSLLTQRYALAVLRETDISPFTLEVTVRGRNAPPNEYGIEFAYCSLSLIITRNQSRIAVLTTPEARGAGTTADQALRKAATVMFSNLRSDPAFEEAIDALFTNVWTEKGQK